MWTIPSNHPLYSAFAQECVASKEDLKEHLDRYKLPLMWKSKHSSSTTWLGRWKKVYWIPRLFGKTLKRSQQRVFTEKYTASLVVIPASPLAMPVSEKEKLTRDTFGRIYEGLSAQLSLFGASSKTWKGTLQWDMTQFTKSYEKWAMQLKQDCLLRLKRARLTSAKGSLSSPLMNNTWSTPKVGGQESYETRIARGKDMGLQGQVEYLEKVENWATPNTMDSLPERSPEAMQRLMTTGARAGRTRPSNLREQINWATPTAGIATSNNPGNQTKDLRKDIKMWPTPATRDHKGSNSDNHITTKDRPHLGQLPNKVKINGQLDQEKTNTTGKPQELNPEWVAQLMGTTLEKIFCECSEMEWWSKQAS